MNASKSKISDENNTISQIDPSRIGNGNGIAASLRKFKPGQYVRVPSSNNALARIKCSPDGSPEDSDRFTLEYIADIHSKPPPISPGAENTFNTDPNLVCSYCFTTNIDVFKYCSRCKVAVYCNSECQAGDWVAGHGHSECFSLSAYRRLLKSPLYHAVAVGDTTKLLAILEQDSAGIEEKASHGFDVNQLICKGVPVLLLHVAAAWGHHTVVLFLLEHGANKDVDVAGISGMSPLHLAAANGHLLVAECLVTHKANINKTDDDGNTALVLATVMGHAKVAYFLANTLCNKSKVRTIRQKLQMFALAPRTLSPRVPRVLGSDSNATDVETVASTVNSFHCDDLVKGIVGTPGSDSSSLKPADSKPVHQPREEMQAKELEQVREELIEFADANGKVYYRDNRGGYYDAPIPTLVDNVRQAVAFLDNPGPEGILPIHHLGLFSDIWRACDAIQSKFGVSLDDSIKKYNGERELYPTNSIKTPLTCKSQLVAAGVINELVAALRNQPCRHEVRMCEHVMATLYYIARDFPAAHTALAAIPDSCTLLVELLRYHCMSSDKVCIEICELMIINMPNPSIRSQLAEAGLGSQLVIVFEAYPLNRAVCFKMVSVMLALVKATPVQPKVQASLTASGCPQAVVAILERQMLNMPSIKQCLQVMMYWDDAGKLATVTAGGGQTVLSVARLMIKLSEPCQWVCASLKALATVPQVVPMLMSDGAVSDLLNIMHSHPTDASLPMLALDTLNVLLKHEDTLLADSPSPSPGINAATLLHDQTAAPQSSKIAALSQHDGVQVPNAIGDATANLPALCAMLATLVRLHTDKPKVCSLLLIALWRLTGSLTASGNGAINAALGAAGMFPPLVTVMERYKDGTAETIWVCEKACAVLWNLSSHPSNQPYLWTAGLCEALVKTLSSTVVIPAATSKGQTQSGSNQKGKGSKGKGKSTSLTSSSSSAAVVTPKLHPGHSSVCEKVCGAIHVVGSSDLENRSSLVIAGAGKALVAALDTYPLDAAVAETACAAMHSLSVPISNCISDPGSIRTTQGLHEAIAQTLRRHRGSLRVCTQTCRALAAVAAVDCHEARVVSAGTGEALVEAMRVHYASNTVFCLYAGEAVVAVANAGSGSRTALAAAGICELLVLALKVHLANGDVCLQVCRAVCTMITVSNVEELKPIFGEAIGVQLNAVASAHGSSNATLRKCIEQIRKMLSL